MYNPDALTDITQVFGMNPQYMQALEVAKKLNYVLRNYDLTFVGHSLGGGEAALAAMVTGRYAITYNPAGLSTISMVWLDVMGYSTDELRIYRYVSTMDEVSFGQYLFGIESQGKGIDVPNVNDYLFQHSIDNLINNMK